MNSILAGGVGGGSIADRFREFSKGVTPDGAKARVNSLELDRALGNVVRYPTATTYTAGTGPYCNGGQCGC